MSDGEKKKTRTIKIRLDEDDAIERIKPKLDAVREFQLEAIRATEFSRSALGEMQLETLRSIMPMQSALSEIAKGLDISSSFGAGTMIKMQEFTAGNSVISASLQSFRNIFESACVIPPSTLSAFEQLANPFPRTELFVDVFKQALQPPPGLEILAKSLQKIMEPPPEFAIHAKLLSEVVSQYAKPLPEAELLGNVWTQFNNQMSLNWEPVLKISATAAGLSALQEWPGTSEVTTEIEEVEDDTRTISFDEARESVFSIIEFEGKQPPHQVQCAFRFLYLLETEIRRFIHNVMISHSGDGWEKHSLPPNMYNGWKEKHAEAVRKGRDPATALIEFADFTDYTPLITSNLNWKIFEPFFGNKMLTQASFQRLFPYRLDTMHARAFAQEELVIVAGDCQWLLKRLGASLF